jgi:hypothetical protein
MIIFFFKYLFQMKKININMNCEKRCIYNKLKYIGIRNNGIIFGGMVRDEILVKHYKILFDEHILSLASSNRISNINKYWDSKYHKESIKRTIIPNDMDIYFQNRKTAETFIEGIYEFANEYNGIFLIENFNLYNLGENLIHRKIYLLFVIGKTIINKGFNININIDLILNTNDDYHYEPPFNLSDFSCNLFIMNKNNNCGYNIRLSKNTGTKLDSMSSDDKIIYEKRIINDLINGKTEFIRTSMNLDNEYINGCRILKMLDKNMKITNLSFKEIEKIEIEEICDICQMSIINNDEPIIEILTNKHAINLMHKKCFIKYLRIEIYKKNRNSETNYIECKCTRRNLFNFNDSYKLSYLY